jgi:hypothetical protein
VWRGCDGAGVWRVCGRQVEDKTDLEYAAGQAEEDEQDGQPPEKQPQQQRGKKEEAVAEEMGQEVRRGRRGSWAGKGAAAGCGCCAWKAS